MVTKYREECVRRTRAGVRQRYEQNYPAGPIEMIKEHDVWISLWDYARKIDQWYDKYKNFRLLLNQEEVEYSEDDNKVHAEMSVWVFHWSAKLILLQQHYFI